MEKKLFMEKPLLTGRLHIAYPLVAIMQHPDGDKFVYNCFMNLECMSQGDDLNLCFTSQVETSTCYGWHFLNYYKKYEDFLAEKEMSLAEAIINEIDNENYIYIAFDEYYLPHKKKFHNLHINLIYGYDDKEKIFWSVGYDEKNIYRELPIPFEAADKAYQFKKVEVYKPNKGKRFEYDFNFFHTQVLDFLSSKNSFLTEEEMKEYFFSKKDFVYGLQVYDRLLAHLYAYIQGAKLDFRNLHQIYELSLMNAKRILFLQNEIDCSIPETIIDDANEICRLSKIIRLLGLKSLVKGDRNITNTVIEKIKVHRQKNEVLYMKMLDIKY